MSDKQASSKGVKKVKIDKLIFSLNETEKTASLIDNDIQIGDVFIPPSINYEGQEFIITSINEISLRGGYEIRSIQFPLDSKVQSIQKDAFINSSVEMISLPPSVSNLEEGCFNETYRLGKVLVDPNNSHFQNYGDDLLYKKSDEKSSEYDFLIYANKKMSTITLSPTTKTIGPLSFTKSMIHSISIPSTVTQICKKAFCFSKNLKIVLFNSDSQLQAIGQSAFCSTSIENIQIPQKVKIICKKAFSQCIKLKRVDFCSNSEIETIENDAFFLSSIETLSIPSSVSQLEEGWCNGTSKLNNVIVFENQNQCNIMSYDKLIIGKSDTKSGTFDVLHFACRDVKTVKLPQMIRMIASFSFANSNIEKIIISSKVEQIGTKAFYSCKKIKNVVFEKGSKLKIIEKEAFSRSSLQEISIPSSVEKICTCAFISCNNLKKVMFSSDSKLRVIEKEAFAFSGIDNMSIPSCVVELNEGWLAATQNLKRVTIFPSEENNIVYYDEKLIIGKSNTKSDTYDVLYFVDREATAVTIPPSITIIESYAFSQSLVENISIPNSVTKICDKAFQWCKKLKEISFSPGSKLHSIETNAFANSSIECLSIPSSIVELKEGWRSEAYDLKKMTIVENEVQNVVSLDNKLIIGKSDTKSNIFDILYFANRNFKTITIPPKIKIIESYAFYCSLIERICIPPHVTTICKSAFDNCKKLRIVDISDDSELKIIEGEAFCNTLIKSFYVPSGVTHIDETIFVFCDILILEFGEGSNIEFIELEHFDIAEDILFMIHHVSII